MKYKATIRTIHSTGAKTLRHSTIHKLFENLQLDNIHPDGASGMIAFETADHDLPAIADRIIAGFRDQLGLPVSLDLRELP